MEIVKLLMPIIVSAIPTSLLGFAFWYLRHNLNISKNRQEKLRQERMDLYDEILDPFNRVIAGIKIPQENKKAINKILSAEYKIKYCKFCMIASDEVINSINNFMQYLYKMKYKQLGVQICLEEQFAEVLISYRLA